MVRGFFERSGVGLEWNRPKEKRAPKEDLSQDMRKDGECTRCRDTHRDSASCSSKELSFGVEQALASLGLNPRPQAPLIDKQDIT
jgi:hypothetical protein